MNTNRAGITARLLRRSLDQAVPHAWLIDQVPFVSPHTQAATGDKESLPLIPTSLSWATGSSLRVEINKEQPSETPENTTSNP